MHDSSDKCFNNILRIPSGLEENSFWSLCVHIVEM